MARTSENSYDLRRLREAIRPFRMHWFPTLGTTNDHAAAMRRRGDLFAPAIVLTGRQTAGRGRGDNTWWSAGGIVTVTFAVPVVDAHAHHVPLLAGLAVRAAAAELCGDDDVQIKWPNDILHDDRKLAGLLCERLDKVDLIGIGMNVNLVDRNVPKALRARVTSLSHIAGRPIDITDAVAALTRHLVRRVVRRAETPFALALREFDRHHALLGRSIGVSANGEKPVTGVCRGLDGQGRLVIETTRGMVHVVAGHVSIR